MRCISATGSRSVTIREAATWTGSARTATTGLRRSGERPGVISPASSATSTAGGCRRASRCWSASSAYWNGGRAIRRRGTGRPTSSARPGSLPSRGSCTSIPTLTASTGGLPPRPHHWQRSAPSRRTRISVPLPASSAGGGHQGSRTPIVYIGGAARSGSTLLERILACVPGYWPVGELVFVWDQVGKTAFGGWDQVDAGEAVALRAAVDRHRHLDRLAGLRPQGPLEPAITAYSALTERLYAAVREVSGASVIVDSSKHVGYALLLRDIGGIDLRLIHLVRRSHGVAYSWTKRVVKPGVGDGTEYMSVHPASWAIGLWTADNLLFDLIARRMPGAARIRYEDLIDDPAGVVARIVSVLELPHTDLSLDFLADGAAALPQSHSLSGNPMRFKRGQMVVRADDEWRSAMSGPRKAAISAATWPLLLRYGYPLSTRREPGR